MVLSPLWDIKEQVKRSLEWAKVGETTALPLNASKHTKNHQLYSIENWWIIFGKYKILHWVQNDNICENVLLHNGHIDIFERNAVNTMKPQATQNINIPI